MKHKLSLDDLTVETFATTPAPRPARGTVRAFQVSLDQACVSTGELLCVEVVTIDSCDATNLGIICPTDRGPTLEMSCGGSCDGGIAGCGGSYDAVSCGGIDVCP